MAELWDGLKNAKLDKFDMLLSGYCPSAALVEQVGKIAREIRFRTTMKPGSFFWVLDPVLGDNGRIYVAEDEVPVYKSLLKDADLILPNQFEVELLSDVKIHDIATMKQAIVKLHQAYQIPHIILTSIRLPPTATNTPTEGMENLSVSAKLSIIGSTRTSDLKPRLFRITVPALPVFFSGTGDMFAALILSRLRQAAAEAGVLNTANWRSPDEVPAVELPLAKAAEKVLASMHAILKDTATHHDSATEAWEQERKHELNEGAGKESADEKEVQRHLKLTRAAEVRVVRNVRALLDPPNLGDFKAQPIDSDVENGHTEEPDELGVVKVAAGEGAVHQT